MLVAGLVVAGIVVLGLVVWAGHRMLTTGPQGGGGSANALGGFSDVFEPARARADDDLKSKENQIEVTPVPEDDDRPMSIDPVRMTVRVRKPPSAPPAPHEQPLPPAGR